MTLQKKMILVFGFFFLMLIGAVLLNSILSGRKTSSFMLRSLNTSATEAAREQVFEKARVMGYNIRAEFEAGLNSARTLAHVLASVRDVLNLKIDREQIDGILRNTVIKNDKFAGAYSCWEPDALDNEDEEYAGRGGTDQTGRFVSYWRKIGKKVELKVLTDYENQEKYENGIRKGEYYLLPRERKKECAVDPHLQPVKDGTNLIISLVAPIIADEEFYGIAGVDIDMDFMQSLTEQTNKRIWSGAGMTGIVSYNGIVAAVSGKPELVGKHIRHWIQNDWQKYLELIREKKDFIDISGNDIEVLIPLEIGKTEMPWGVIINIPKKPVLVKARHLVRELKKRGEKDMIWQVGGGLAVALIAFAVIWLITRKIVEPILHSIHFAGLVAKGDLAATIDTDRKDEIGDLINALNSMTLQLRENFEEMEEKNAELERLDRLKDEFLANTSHELRTPLNGIIGIADSLINGSLGPLTEGHQYNLSLIVSSGHRLTSLINDILDFSKLRQHDLHLMLKPVDMRSNTDVVFMLSQTLGPGKNIQLVNRIPADIPAVEADENRVQQILHNLVGNAIKFTKAGTVSVSARVREQYLAVTVSDTGIGIPKDKLDSIFEAFEQADGSTEREYGGTGLGLSVTRDLVKLHGGRIWAESDPGKGSDFTFTLPVSGEKAEAAHGEDMLRQPARIAGISKISEKQAEIRYMEEPDLANIPQEQLCDGMLCRVLAVDDEPVNLQVLKNQLASEHYSVTLAANGEEALAAIENGQPFDVVLLDVMMPGMSGYEVCQRLRETHPPNELPIVMLTAKNQVDDLVAGFGSGASDYLAKPFSKLELLARLDTHIALKYLHLKHMKAETKAKLLAHEMNLTKHIQTSLVPENPELPGYDIAASIDPADEVGGDYYDVISAEGYDWIIIGDVTGHGVPAGLVMMMVQTAIHTVIYENPEVSPCCLLSAVNRSIYKNIQRIGESKHMTIVVLLADRNGDFTFSGMHDDILIRRTDTGKVDIIEPNNAMWIGIEPDISKFVSSDTLKLEPGDCMVLYTDGITEAVDENDNMFGDKRLIKIIEKSGNKSAYEIHKNVTDALEPWKKLDDMTLIVVKRVK